MTGYLTQRGESSGNRYNLVIPNREIRNIITNHILKMFKENVKDDGKTVSDLCDALLNLSLIHISTPFHEALFTATSAVCVTGLVVKDTGSYWSLAGQTIILAPVSYTHLLPLFILLSIAHGGGPAIYRCSGQQCSRPEG